MANNNNDDDDYEELYKLVMVGDKGVGKTSILNKFVDDDYVFKEDIPSTIGVDFKSKVIELDDKKCKLQIWDTAGDPKYGTITNAYYRGARGVLIVYDVTNRDSFNNVRSKYVKAVREAGDEDARICLVGNKSDQSERRSVTFGQGKELAGELGVIFLETSVKDSHYAADPFIQLVIEVNRKETAPYKKPPTAVLKPPSAASASSSSSSSSSSASSKGSKKSGQGVVVKDSPEEAGSQRSCVCCC